MKCRTSLALYGDSGDGKTTQLGVLAEYRFRTQGRRTRLYSTDLGGWETIKPYQRLGIMEIIDITDLSHPWEAIDAAAKHKRLVDGKWQDEPNPDQWDYAYDGGTGACDMMMQDLAYQASQGKNIGGGVAVSLTDGSHKLGGNNQSHFGLAQTGLLRAIGLSVKGNIPGAFVTWTFTARRGEDKDSTAVILGPQAAGKALTGELPRLFTYCWRIMSVPADPVMKTAGEHRLYLEDHKDLLTPGAKVVGNDRIPLDAKPLTIPYIVPADVVAALQLLEGKDAEAEAAIRARLVGLDLTPHPLGA
jgi:hypothetical protein